MKNANEVVANLERVKEVKAPLPLRESDVPLSELMVA